MENNYKLVILGHEWDLYKISYSDILKGVVKYVGGYKPQNTILRFLFKIHLTPKVNRYVNLPFKYIWNKCFLKGINQDEKVVFLVFQNWLSIDNTICTIDYLKRTYKRGKIILFLQDIVSSFKDLYNETPIDVLSYKDKCDMIITYDKIEAERYGFSYHPTVFSHKSLPNCKEYDYDVFFIGKYKGRLDLLLNIYKKLSSKGVVCKFIVLNVPREKRQLSNEIQYIDRSISYYEVLQYVNRTKCVLEVLQTGAVGYTYRLWEAISYNKVLLTNNVSLIDSDFYDCQYISIFHSVDDIDISFIKDSKIPPYDKTNPYSAMISPNNLVKFIEQKLNVKIQL